MKLLEDTSVWPRWTFGHDGHGTHGGQHGHGGQHRHDEYAEQFW